MTNESQSSGGGKGARSISQSPEYRLNIGPIIKDDETLTLTVTKAYAEAEHSFALDATGGSGSVTIYQAPEFISDADEDVDADTKPFEINSDYWNLPKKYRKIEVGTVVIAGLPCAKNRPVKYSIIGATDAWINDMFPARLGRQQELLLRRRNPRNGRSAPDFAGAA